MRYNITMKVLVFDTDQGCRDEFAGLIGHEVIYIEGPVTQEALAEHSDAEIVSLFVSSAFPKDSIDALPRLKCIATRSTGVDHIDVAYAAQKGVAVVNVPHYGARTVAEFTFALILALTRRIFDATYQVREEGSFKTGALEGFDLFGKTIGVIGTGAIGRNVVRIAQGFGMSVLMYDAFPDPALKGPGAKYVSLEELVAASDVVTLHVPFTRENYHMLGMEQFARMKQGALVINTARGELIDTEALLEALKRGTVSGAGLDVLEGERALKDEMELVRGSESIQDLKSILRNHMLIDMPQVIITPHIAFFSREAYREILSTTLSNIQNFCDGKQPNAVAV